MRERAAEEEVATMGGLSWPKRPMRPLRCSRRLGLSVASVSGVSTVIWRVSVVKSLAGSIFLLGPARRPIGKWCVRTFHCAPKDLG